MKPVSTIYRLTTPRDVHVCKEIWAANAKLFGEPRNLSWPTVVAERNGKILGFMSTNAAKKFLLAGPLIIGKDCHAITVIRLVEAYEVVLKMAKVTSYWFHVEQKNKNWIKLIHKLGVKEKEKSETGLWFERKLV